MEMTGRWSDEAKGYREEVQGQVGGKDRDEEDVMVIATMQQWVWIGVIGIMRCLRKNDGDREEQMNMDMIDVGEEKVREKVMVIRMGE